MIGLLRRRRWSLAWLLGIVLLGVALGVLATIPLLRAPTDGTVGSLVGQPAPALAAARLGGGAWDLASDAEGRWTWVNFWAISCEPCRTEMPAMQRLAEAHAGDLLVVGVNWGEEQASVADFVERYGVDYTILMDPRLENYHRWAGRAGLPIHYFVSPDGVVAREVIGPLDPAVMVAILDALLS